ncbi:ATP-dependent DNA helicase RecG [Weissella beninensis]|uniref:ATP-dependent DNA helicase RecG n=1 Tax=Periweissella beninensis TaxID=504936 RepID=A0ABT0VFH7_9LACO|nr:ATP-dependent DNA helicase RecG [Periweissella beninensis]MBM7543473.1 ATP-dependent DNA helicase RecG [Periweissella beninensis]MCM2436456.1 ATP-dependent DNA helicase RecG [Periweissella beninensis]
MENSGLTTNINELDGVGPKRLSALNNLGIFNVGDLLEYFPFRYDDMQTRIPSTTKDGEKVTFSGIVSSEPVLTRFGYKKTRLNFNVLIGHENIKVTFFNQPWLQKEIKREDPIAVYGVYDANRASLAGIKVLTTQVDGLNGIYPTSKAIKAKTIQDLIEQAFAKYSDQITNLIPAIIQTKYRLVDRRTMIHDMHFPQSSMAVSKAKRTAAFEEFFIFQVNLQLIKLTKTKKNGRIINYDNLAVKDFIAKLPFELTTAQKKVVNEIAYDLKRPIHMNRLLQGDVGSGKTVVAVIEAYATITANMQVAIMAPTEILAQQHAKSFGNFFAKSNDIRVELLTSATKTKERRQILADLLTGEIDVIIGTHALIQNDIEFHNLGLAIIDEQHRFGVKQRAILREKGMNPDILAMTATPIPRTLAITAYGEMDVSLIDELPAGRQPIKTKWLKNEDFEQAIEFMRTQINKGAQAYIVAPLIEESENLDVQNATAIYENLNAYLAPKIKVGLLHGRMKNSEKEHVMAEFKANMFQVLVATTVIEVGVDVPNATVMLILDADRFGLAQLHQLRGRVGRGAKQSYTLLLADPKSQYGKQRMAIMTETTNGFVLAQKDLELRGQGDILGNKQSGIPDFRIGDPIADLKMMEIAQQEAIQLIDTPNWDSVKSNQALVQYLSERMARYRNLD